MNVEEFAINSVRIQDEDIESRKMERDKMLMRRSGSNRTFRSYNMTLVTLDSVASEPLKPKQG